MPFTVNEIAISLISETGDNIDDVDYVAQVEAWINDVSMEIINTSQWKFLYQRKTLTLSAGTSEYALDEDMSEIVDCQITGSDLATIYFVNRERLRYLGLDLTTQGKPSVMYDGAYDPATGLNYVGFYPTPDGTYTAQLVGLYRPISLDSGDTIPFPNEFIPVLKDGVRRFIFEDDGQLDRADKAQMRYFTGIKMLKDKHEMSPAENLVLKITDVPADTGFPDAMFDPSHFRND